MNNIALAILLVGLLLALLVLCWPDSEFTKVMERAEEGDTSPAVFNGISNQGVRMFMSIPAIARENQYMLELRRELRKSAEHVLFERGVRP